MNKADTTKYDSLQQESSGYSNQVSGLQDDIKALQKRIDKIDEGITVLGKRRRNFEGTHGGLVRSISRKQSGVRSKSASEYHGNLRAYVNGTWQPRALDAYDALKDAALKAKAELEGEISEKQSRINSCNDLISSLSYKMSALKAKSA
jgi:peptidoglycan hydrolase CwlO-like protein